MQIEYSDKAKKFVISCSFQENSKITSMPNKRFQRRSRVWHAPALSRNAEFLLENLREHMTERAVEVAEQAVNRSRIQRVPFPAWFPFKTEPFKHQQQALDHVWGLDRFALFMEMGTGKSKIVCDYYAAAMMNGDIDVWVIFCPNGVRDTWINEQIPEHFALSGVPTFMVGDLTDARQKKMVEQAKRAERFIAVVGLESMQQKERDGRAYNTLTSMIGGRQFGLTVDESHYIKTPSANRAKNTEHVADSARIVNVMTGTPTTRCILDLYQQFQTLDPNIIGIGDYYSFRNQYAEFGGYENREVVGYRNLDELMGLIKPYVFQCTKDEAIDLPPKTYTKRTCSLTKEQTKAYRDLKEKGEAVVKDMQAEGKSAEVIADQVLTQYNALQQITGGFVNHDDEDGVRQSAWITNAENNPKVRELLAVAAESPDAQIIVWAKFRNEIAMIVEALSDYGVAEYHGGLTQEERKESISRFKSGEARFFVANQATGGTGLTLNEATVDVYFSNSLQYAQRVQSEDRNHRIGQEQHVTYVDLVASGTVDESILESMRTKQDVAEYVREKMDTGEKLW